MCTSRGDPWPCDRAGDGRQNEQGQKPEDPVDHHRRDRLRSSDSHPPQVSRLDQIAADAAGYHQVENHADRAQHERASSA